jgi:GTP-binding protein
LLSSISAAKPKIADYPFTTLEPNLGIVGYRGTQSFVMADIPGIIEGASEGKGLGLRFLRHIERNAVLLFMVPADTNEIRKEYQILLNELERFNPDLVDKGRVLAITKCDMLDEELMDEIRRTDLPEGVPTVFISSVTGLGLTELKDTLWRTINDEDNRIPSRITHRDLDVKHRVTEEDEFIIEQESGDVEESWDVEWPEEYWESDFADED